MRKILAVMVMLAVTSIGCAYLPNPYDQDAFWQTKQSSGNLKDYFKEGGPKTAADLTAEANKIVGYPIIFTAKMAKQALAYYAKAIELDPNYIPAYMDMGSLKVAVGRKDLAVVDFQKACDLSGKDGCGWVEALHRQGYGVK